MTPHIPRPGRAAAALVLAAAAALALPAVPAAALPSPLACPSIPANADPAVTATVYDVGTGLHVTDRVMLAGFEAGWVESHMNNLPCGDLDSLGVFQQRASWGTAAQRRDVRYAANAFFTRAISQAAAHPGYTAGQVAQAVQVSAFPDRYDAVENTAEALLEDAAGRAPGAPGAGVRKGRSGGAAVSWAVNRVDAFGRGGDQLKHNFAQSGGTVWPGWESLGAGLASQPVAVSWGPGRLDVFGVGTDRLMKHWWFDRNGDARWRGPETLGPTTFTGTPTAVSWNTGRLDVFARDTNGALRHTFYQRDNTTTFSAWETLLGPITADPTAVSWTNGRLDILAPGPDRTLRHWWFDRNGENRWRGPETIGTPTIQGPVSAVSWTTGRLDIFARDTTNALIHTWTDTGSGFQPWQVIPGGGLTGIPAAVSWAPGRLDVFATGAGQRMRHWWYEGHWNASQEMGTTTFADAPVATSWASGRLDVFARDTDGALRHSFFRRGVDTTLTGWENLAGTLT